MGQYDSLVHCLVLHKVMNGKEAEANESSETTDQHEHNQQNLAAPPSYDEIIHTQSLIHNNGGDRKLEHVEHQPIRLQLSPDSYHNYPSTGVFTIRPAVGLYPEHLICPFCQDEISTRVEYVTTAKTHINAMLCCAM